MNRDLSRRIRTVNALTAHKQVVRHDIKLSAKIVHNLDRRVGLWKEEKADDDKIKENKSHSNTLEIEQAVSWRTKNKINKLISWIDLQAFGLSSKNPVLKNITDYLIEEASAEEEELLGMSGDQEEGQLGGDGDSIIERDPVLMKVSIHVIF